MKKGLKSLSVVLLSVLGMVGCAGNNESSKESHSSSNDNFEKALDILKDFCDKLDEILPEIDKDKE